MILLLAVLAAVPEIQVSVSPPGKADVYVDGTRVGETGVPLQVNKGILELRVTRPGYFDGWGDLKVTGGLKKVTITQRPGIPMQVIDLEKAFFPGGSGDWSARDQNPWKVVDRNLKLCPPLPGSNAPGWIRLAITQMTVISCEVYVSGGIRELELFGQRIHRSSKWTKVLILIIGKREFVCLNWTGFRKANTVRDYLNVKYTVNGKCGATIRRVQCAEMSLADTARIQKVYRLK